MLRYEEFEEEQNRDSSPFSTFIGGQCDCSLKKCCKKYKKKSKKMCKSCPKR